MQTSSVGSSTVGQEAQTYLSYNSIRNLTSDQLWMHNSPLTVYTSGILQYIQETICDQH